MAAALIEPDPASLPLSQHPQQQLLHARAHRALPNAAIRCRYFGVGQAFAQVEGSKSLSNEGVQFSTARSCRSGVTVIHHRCE
jgi:hypothetical protein